MQLVIICYQYADGSRQQKKTTKIENVKKWIEKFDIYINANNCVNVVWTSKNNYLNDKTTT